MSQKQPWFPAATEALAEGKTVTVLADGSGVQIDGETVPWPANAPTAAQYEALSKVNARGRKT